MFSNTGYPIDYVLAEQCREQRNAARARRRRALARAARTRNAATSVPPVEDICA